MYAHIICGKWLVSQTGGCVKEHKTRQSRGRATCLGAEHTHQHSADSRPHHTTRATLHPPHQTPQPSTEKSRKPGHQGLSKQLKCNCAQALLVSCLSHPALKPNQTVLHKVAWWPTPVCCLASNVDSCHTSQNSGHMYTTITAQTLLRQGHLAPLYPMKELS